jgi:hypothetical protein
MDSELDLMSASRSDFAELEEEVTGRCKKER